MVVSGEMSDLFTENYRYFTTI